MRDDIGYGSGGAVQFEFGGEGTILNSTFRGNQANDWGGAISNDGGSPLTIVGSTFAENVALDRGGALYSGDRTSVLNSTFVGNRTNGYGSAVFASGNHGDLTLAHTTIAGNRSDGEYASWEAPPAGLYVHLGHVALSHTNVAGNYAGPDREAGDMVLDSIHLDRGENDLTASYSLIGDAASAGGIQDRTLDPEVGNLVGDGGSGVIDLTTVLLNANGDRQIDAYDLLDYGGPTLAFALAVGSAAIDAGDPNFAPDDLTPPLKFDQRGVPRVMNGRIDIGATEFDTAAWRNPWAAPDVDDNGVVSIQDLLIAVRYIRDHGVTHVLPDRLPATSFPTLYIDVNGDGISSVADLLPVVRALRNQLSTAPGEGERQAVDISRPSHANLVPAPTTLFPYDPHNAAADDDEWEESDLWLSAIAADVAHGQKSHPWQKYFGA